MAEHDVFSVINAVQDMGVNSLNVQTVRNFLILNDDYFDSDDYFEFVQVCTALGDTYIAPIAEERFNKTPAQLTEEERYDVWGALNIDSRREISETMLIVSKEHGVLISQDYDANVYPVFYYNLRDDGASVGTIQFYTAIGTAPQPIEYGAELPTIPPTDGMANTGWVNYYGVPVTSTAYEYFGYAPTLKAIWEDIHEPKKYITKERIIMSGYQIISLRDTPFVTGGAAMMLDGIYDQIEGNNRKPILLDGIIIDGVEKNAVYTEVNLSGSSFEFTVYGKKITITDTDAVSVVNA